MNLIIAGILLLKLATSSVYSERLGRCKPDFVDSQGNNCTKYVEKKWCTPNCEKGEGWGGNTDDFSNYEVDGYDARACPGCGCIGKCKADFVDSGGDNCKLYVDTDMCTPNGGYGAGWGASDGTFSSYQVDCYNARNCPGCGCIDETTTTTSTTTKPLNQDETVATSKTNKTTIKIKPSGTSTMAKRPTTSSKAMSTTANSSLDETATRDQKNPVSRDPPDADGGKDSGCSSWNLNGKKKIFLMINVTISQMLLMLLVIKHKNVWGLGFFYF